MEMVFIGTGGGRFATITQKRRTGGIRVISDKVNMHLDPGPGALIYSLEEGLDPRKVNAVLISHCHPDHYADGEILIEAMTAGATKRSGDLVCARSVTSGNEICGPSVSKYHQSLPNKVYELTLGSGCKTGETSIETTKAVHYDPDSIGFKISFPDGKSVGYSSDTEYFEGIGKQYSRLDLLVLCVVRPRGSPLKWHMCVDDVVKILEEAKPEKAVLTHFGMRMIVNVSPEAEAKYVEEQTGVPTIAARDGMRIETNGAKAEKRGSLTQFL